MIKRTIKVNKKEINFYYTEQQLQEKARILELQSEKSLPTCVWSWRIWHDKAQELMKQVARHKK